MNDVTAKKIWKLIYKEVFNDNDSYALEIINDGSKKEKHFHTWINRKKLLGIIKIVRLADTLSLHFILLEKREWNKNIDECYFIIYKGNRSKPIIEIWKTKTVNDTTILYWEYQPSKQDGKNMKRKQYFETHYKDSRAMINIPKSHDEVLGFIDELFILSDIRIKADNLDKKLLEKTNMLSKRILTKKEIDAVTYLPTKSDCEKAMQKLKKNTSRKEFNASDLLDILEADSRKKRRTLRKDWRNIIKNNFKTWFN